MKLLSRVKAIQVKRAFVAAQLVRHYGKKRYMPLLTKEEFIKAFSRAKAQVGKMTGAQLDRFIGKEYIPRRDAYRGVQWYIGFITPSEVGVWKGAGGLPIAWTKNSLADTARWARVALENDSKLLKSRAKRSIPRIIATSIEAAQNEKYLLPIVLPPGTIKNCRKGAKRMKGEVDDGCMRSIALVVSGRKKIKAYIGINR